MHIDNYFEQQGSGAPIVFIHGSYASTSTWKKMIEQLALNNHCISIKLPGHGGMPDPDDFSDPTIETELSILEQVVTSLTDEPVHLVGHSYGGVVALSQALKGNLTLSQMTLFEPVAVWVLDIVNDTGMSKHVKRFLPKFRHDVFHKIPYSCGQVIDFWGGDGAFEPLPNSIKDSMDALVINNIRHWDVCSTINHRLTELQNCVIPTRVVCGNQSNPVAHAISEHLNREIPNSKKYVIEGASHFLVTSHVNECLSVLEDSSIF
jgi:pimeloyl-ACP methyl ester carboxylesterase